MRSEDELHRLIDEISQQTSRCTSSSAARLAECRASLRYDRERKALDQQALASSQQTLSRDRD